MAAICVEWLRSKVSHPCEGEARRLIMYFGWTECAPLLLREQKLLSESSYPSACARVLAMLSGSFCKMSPDFNIGPHAPSWLSR
jgi:hypothetical protein